MHTKFYENTVEWYDIQVARTAAQAFIALLAQVREEESRPFTIRSATAQQRIGQLLGLDANSRAVLDSPTSHWPSV